MAANQRDPPSEVAPVKVAVVKESAPAERRVALTPEAVAKLQTAGHEILVETGAGAGAYHFDESYSAAGASVVTADQATEADALLLVGRPSPELIGKLRPGQAIFGLFAPLTDPELAERLAATGATAVSLDMIPRTLPRAQPMDALSSQANISGYKAVLK